MSIKSTQRITRDTAISLLQRELETASNNQLATILDRAADSGLSHHLSIFDNFIVSDFADTPDVGFGGGIIKTEDTYPGKGDPGDGDTIHSFFSGKS